METIKYGSFLKKYKDNSAGFWKDILFNESSIFGTKRLKQKCYKEINKLNDPFFIKKSYKYYSRDAFKRYVTLSMESWYIDQNISGILKKCSELSGLKYSDITEDGGIVPWQYNNERIPDIGKLVYHNYKSREDKVLNPSQKKICKVYDLDIETTDINDKSFVANLIKIEDYIKQFVNNSGRRSAKHKEVIDYIQNLYDPNPLFPVTKFTQDIEDYNNQIDNLTRRIENSSLS